MYEYRATIGGVAYDIDKLTEISQSRQLFDDVGVGNVCTGSATVSVRTDDVPARAAEVWLWWREKGAETWEPKGAYMISTRSKNGAVQSFNLYDLTARADATYLDLTTFDEWPQTDEAVTGEIAALMGVEIDARTELKGYAVPYPNDLTMREELGYIAAANAGNWTLTDEGKLRLVKLVPDAEQSATDIGKNAQSFKDLGKFDAFTGVTIWWDDENAFQAGDSSGRVLELDCPWATQAMADAILNEIKGYAWQGAEASRAEISPAMELGGVVICNDLTFVLAQYDAGFDVDYRPDISAPGDDEVDYEYEYESKTTRELARKVTLGAQYYGVTIDRTNGLYVTRKDSDGNEYSNATINSDLWNVVDDDGNTVLTFDFAERRYKFYGDIVIPEGSISFDELDPSVTNAIDTAATVAEQIANGTYSGGTFIDGTSIYAPNIYGGATLNIGENGSGYNFVVDENGNVTMNGDLQLTGGALTYTTNLIHRYGGDDNPSYIRSSYISDPVILGPEIYGGWLYATGKGAEDTAAYYICDGVTGSGANTGPGEILGYISYDTNGSGIFEEENRVIFHTNDMPLKLESGSNMSLEANGRIWVMSPFCFSTASYGYTLPTEDESYGGQIFFLLGE